MKIQQGFKITIIALSLMGLAACSSTRTGAGAAVDQAGAGGAGAGAGADGVAVSGAGGDGAYGAGAVSGSGYGSTANCNPPQPAGRAENAYYFDFNQSDVHSEDMNSLQSLAQSFTANPNKKLYIYGNTDVRGSPAYNQALGERRADAVVSVLKQYGVSNPMTVVSYGAEKPIAFGNTEQDYQCNRRVDLQYEK